MNDFNWVNALASCSASQVFDQLKQQVSSDVDVRQSHCDPNSEYKFLFQSHSMGTFSVLVVSTVLGSSNTAAAVHFKLKKDSIQVDGLGYEGAPKLEATLTLNDEGECRAKIDGQEREVWQLRKMAL